MAILTKAAVKLNVGEPRTVLTAAGLKVLEQLDFGSGSVGPYYVGGTLETIEAAQVSLKGKYVYFSVESSFLITTKAGSGSVEGNPLGQAYLNSMGILRVWQRARGHGVRIGVLDAEFDPQLHELKPAWDRYRAAYTVFGEDEQPMLREQNGRDFPRLQLGENHGTICAALAAGGISRGSAIGVAPDAALVPLALGTRVSSIMIARALAYLANAEGGGCQVISCSVGDLLNQPGKEVVLDALSYVESQGVLIVYAVANSDGKVSDDYLAADPRVIATAAVDERNNRVMGAVGSGLACVAQTAPAFGPDKPAGREQLPPGNSWSAPIIAGIVALIRSSEPDLAVVDVRNRLKETTDDLGDRDQFGWGLVRADRALGLSNP